MRQSLLAAVVLVVSAFNAQAALVSLPQGIVFTAGPGQVFQVGIVGHESINGALLNLALSGGSFTDINWSGSIFHQAGYPLPTIPSVIFDDSRGPGTADGLYADYGPMSQTPAVSPNGHLATVTIDTTGLLPGTYTIFGENDLGQTSLWDNQSGGLWPCFAPAGSFIITPEPTGLLLFAAGVVLLRRRR